MSIEGGFPTLILGYASHSETVDIAFPRLTVFAMLSQSLTIVSGYTRITHKPLD